MIDIISSSIRLGKYLRGYEKYSSIYLFHNNLKLDESLFDYKKLLNANFRKYGFFAFDYVDKVITSNLDNSSDIARNLSKMIREQLDLKDNYSELLDSAKNLGEITEEYIRNLLTEITSFPELRLPVSTTKVRQLSNELSTSIIRSGLFQWINDSKYVNVYRTEKQIINDYEKQRFEYKDREPYCKEIKRIIKGLSGKQRKIAYIIENIYLVEHIVRCGIIQGFFFELYDINENDIIKIKETNKDKLIHPVVIRINSMLPSDNLKFFTYTINDNTKYLLTEKMVFKFTPKEASTTLYGYSYPTNEYLLFKND